ncbi:NAD(P)-dependent oxidoreductase [Sphingobium lactosutens]|uniref:SDR family NAD(P)-dependent oxidoreductase n=1 Tax=Sphingobium lactosutens TaxID=522773 RepID=UPI0015BE0677|nr:SDR family oxidoreductase [Sphingobium lactosutens]NWK97905.1 NAD(P)-dependent oxidoreductase [Sphingobium lactosutens]
MSLKDKVAVVLGASAEGGTGWAIAEALAEAGAKVVVAARSMGDLQRLADKIGGLAVQCDAGSEADIAALARAAADAHGAIDIAVNSAALPVISLIKDVTMEQLQQGVEVNYFAHVHFIRHMTDVMNDGGSITLISSNSTVQPQPPHFAYACAKAATDCLVGYAALEYGNRGIRVNSLLPGPIKSALASGLFSIPGVEEIYARHVPLGRIGLPRDYADTVVFLSGPTYITGVNLPVSGGNHLTGMPRLEEIESGADAYRSAKTA